MKKESQRVVPDFNLNPTILSAQTFWGALPTHAQHKYTFIILYQGRITPIEHLLNADAILPHPEQVDEDLSAPILALP